MQIISVILAALHLFLVVDASPIASSATLESTPSDALLLQSAGQSPSPEDKDPTLNGASLGRDSALKNMYIIDQQKKASEGTMGWSFKGIFDSVKKVVGTVDEVVKELDKKHKSNSSDDENTKPEDEEESEDGEESKDAEKSEDGEESEDGDED
ncbi:hypothetical protein DSO57_1009137 [Entomophthora muscae]|uniref:Uncharacterized protein n=2 Tax=Entomophthora muscae TaxID=34485 RepID=A0ACC2TU07_9FUNG|nr:hypothetical protein DSO57_1009136 [Entomophthora muscae]KAJ9078218.1 hypothetical protein DSO57_1009137 [Entomophthora muscae]